MTLVKANIIEALETGTVERAHSVIWNQEPLLPSHEYVFPLHPAGDLHSHLSRILLIRAESRKLGPMLRVYQLR
jgi:hypothetical protein